MRVLRDAHLSAMHKDKRYKEKEEEEELDELESSALLLFGCDYKRETFATSPPSNECCFNRILTFYDYDHPLPLLALATKFGANSLYEAACRCV